MKVTLHGEHACCKHEHRYDMQENHDEHTCCGHDHHDHIHSDVDSCAETRSEEKVQIHLHDGAVVASAACTVVEEKEQVDAVFQKLEDALKTFGAWVRAQGGIIGHIKVSVEQKNSRMYSLTDEILNCTEQKNVSLYIQIAAIIYLIEEKQLEDGFSQLIRRVESDA